MYLYIFEDCTVKYSTTFEDDDRQACDDRMLDVIDLHTENPKQYYDGEWHNIDSLN